MEEQLPTQINLWESLLRESSASKTRVSPGVLFFLGDNSCGKKELLERFCDGVKGISISLFVTQPFSSFSLFLLPVFIFLFFSITNSLCHITPSYLNYTHFVEENKFEVSEMVSYNYFSASDPDENEKEVECSRVGVWSISAKAIEAGNKYSILVPTS